MENSQMPGFLVRACLKNRFLVGTGLWPLPLGDSPGAAATAFPADQDGPFRQDPPLPVGGSPTGTGESLARPIFQTRS